MDNQLFHWFRAHKPTRRSLIQLYAALLYNAHIKGFIQGDIYTGPLKSVCVPGFNCYSCPGAIGACPLGSLQNALNASGQRAPFFVVGILLLYGIMLGRTICGWLCPAGWIQELLHKLPTPKIQKSRFTHGLSYCKYAILLIFVIAIPLSYAGDQFPVPAFCKYICPVGTGEGALVLLSNPANEGLLGLLGILFTRKIIILLLIVLASIFLYRFFCRFLCPLGAIYSLFARLSVLGVKVEKTQCTQCGACISLCKMDVRQVGDHECIHCGECISACTQRAIHFQAGSIKLFPNEAAKEKPAQNRRFSSKRMIIGVVAIIFLCSTIWYVNRGGGDTDSGMAALQQPSEQAELLQGKEVGQLCPDFTIPLYGKEDGSFCLSAQKGKITVINFWGTTCAPCIAELPYFEKIAYEYGEKVAVVAIHTEPVIEEDEAEAFFTREGIQLQAGWDEDDTVFSLLGGGSVLPMTVIVDQEGIIVYNQVKSITYEALREIIDPLLP